MKIYFQPLTGAPISVAPHFAQSPIGAQPKGVKGFDDINLFAENKGLNSHPQ